jgi:hypothetical protein
MMSDSIKNPYTQTITSLDDVTNIIFFDRNTAEFLVKQSNFLMLNRINYCRYRIKSLVDSSK